MPRKAVSIAVARMAVAVVVVGTLVMCEDYTCRAWLGGGYLLTGIPACIWITMRKTLKIGKDMGETQAFAEIIKEHCRTHQPG